VNISACLPIKEYSFGLASENAGCRSVQRFLSAAFYPKIQNFQYTGYNFADCFVWVWSFGAHIEGGNRLRMFGNRVLGRIFWPKRDEETQKWIRLHNDELYHLYASPNIVGVIRTRRMTWVDHIAFIVIYAYRFLLRNMREREYLVDMGIVGRMVLKRIFKELEVARTGLIWLRIGTDGVCCECSNQPSVSVKRWEFFD